MTASPARSSVHPPRRCGTLQTIRIRHTDRRPVTDAPVAPAVGARPSATSGRPPSTRGLHLLRRVRCHRPRLAPPTTARGTRPWIPHGRRRWPTGPGSRRPGPGGVRASPTRRSRPATVDLRPEPRLRPRRLSAHRSRSRPWRPHTPSSTATTTPPGLATGRGGAQRDLARGDRTRPAPYLPLQRGHRGSRHPARLSACSPVSASLTSRSGCLGVADPDHAGPPHTPRLPADQVVEIVG